MALTFSKIILTLRLQKNIGSPYIFFNLHKQFEAAFRQTVNCGQPSCNGCRRDRVCPYSRVFAQSLAMDPSALKKYQKPSLPFVFHLPLLADLPNKGMSVALEIILIGPATEYHRQFIQAVALVYSDLAVPLKAECADYQGNRYLLMGGRGEEYSDRLFLFSAEELQKNELLDRAEVSLVTPMLLLRQGHALREFTFSTFVRALFRRVSSLAYYYGGDEMPFDFKWLAEQSCRVQTIESDLVWSEWKIGPSGGRVGGITGRIEFFGGLEVFSPFLLLGRYFNLGKGAAFGRGKYLIE
jgi:hypothetical protein